MNTVNKQRKYGYQAIQDLIQDDGRTIRGFVRSLKTDHSHAILAIAGRVPPSPELRAELVNRLGVPLTAMFSRTALDAEYSAPQGNRRKVPV